VEILRSIGNGQSVHQIVRRLMKGHDPAMIYFNFNQLYAAGVFESVPIPDGNAHLEKH
jgi:hypothetical protein